MNFTTRVVERYKKAGSAVYSYIYIIMKTLSYISYIILQVVIGTLSAGYIYEWMLSLGPPLGASFAREQPLGSISAAPLPLLY